MTPPIFGLLEQQHGLPSGILDYMWGIESSRGQNMLNKSTGAAGHFQIMPSNYQAAGIDPYGLAESANWTAEEGARALSQFPGLDPVTAMSARHYGGADTSAWGPNTTKYVNRFRSHFGMDPISNAALVSMAGGDPAGRSGTPVGLMVRTAHSPLLGTVMQEPLIPAQVAYQQENLLTSPRFWADFAAGIDPQMLPGQAIAMGLSNAYKGVDQRRLAFEDQITGGAQRRFQNQLALQRMQQQQRQAQVSNELQRQRLAMQQAELERGPETPSDIRSIEALVEMGYSPEEAVRLRFPSGATSGMELQNIGGVTYMVGTTPTGERFVQPISELEQQRRQDVIGGEQRAETLATEWAKRRPETIAKTAEDIGSYTSMLSDTDRLLRDFEAGKFSGKVGPLRSNITQYFDPDVATLRAQEISSALQNLGVANLGQITDTEMRLIRNLSVSPDLTESQNIAMLKRLQRIQREKLKALRDTMRKIASGKSLEEIALDPYRMPEIQAKDEAIPPLPDFPKEPMPTAPAAPPTKSSSWDDLLGGF